MAGRPTNEPANYLAVGKQSAKDTEATTFYFLRHLDGTGLEIEENVESVREGGDGQEVGLRYKTEVSEDGVTIANARPEWAARSFAHGLGADSVAGGSGAASAMQIHTAVPTSAIPYLTLEVQAAGEIERVSNAQITGLTVEAEAGRPLKFTNNYIGGGTPYRRDAASALTPARETGQPFYFPGGSYTIDGAGNSKITKFKADVARGVDGDIRTTQLFREDVVALNFDTALEFTLKYEDKTLYDKIHYGSGSQVPIDLATGSFQAYSQFGSGTLGRFIELNFPVFQYVGARVNQLDPDGKTVYIDVSAQGIKGATHQFYTRVQTASSGAF